MKDDKTKVIIKNDDQRYEDFKKGEEGYIDGYIRGGDNVPYAVVCIGDRLVMISLHCLTVVL